MRSSSRSAARSARCRATASRRSWSRRFGTGFPLGTLLINVTGCALIGFFLAALNGRWSGINDGWKYLLPIGFVGAYTTFSTYEYEMARLVEAGACRAWLPTSCCRMRSGSPPSSAASG